MSWTFCISGAAVAKAGSNVLTSVLSGGTVLDNFSDDAEGRIEQETNTDWTTNYATHSTSIKNMLSETSSSLIAMKMINASLTNYPSMRLAETLLDFNDDIATKGINTLRGKADTLKTP